MTRAEAGAARRSVRVVLTAGPGQLSPWRPLRRVAVGDDRSPESEGPTRRSSSEPINISSDLAAIQPGCFMRNILKLKSTPSSRTSNNYTHTPGVNGIKPGGAAAMKGGAPCLLLSITLAGRRLPWGREESEGGGEHHWDLAYIHSFGPEEQREERDARQWERKMRQQD